jgi:AAHS family 3-hydroxyphenylpropionic acid transporter
MARAPTTAGKLRTSGAVAVAVCVAVAALEGYDIQAFGVAAPKLAPELRLNSSQLGWAGSAAMFGLVIGAFLGGWLADRIGRKPVLFWSVAAFGVFSIASALAGDAQPLFLARFLTGLGFGGAMPNLIAIATELSPPSRRAATVTTIFCGMPAGGAAVALLVRLVPDLDWRALFMIGGVSPLLVLPLVHLLLPETRPTAAPEADRRLLPALFAGRRAAVTLLLWLAFMLTLVVLYLMLNWLPTLVEAKGFSKADGATASLAFNLTSIVGALIMGFVADRAGFRWLLTLAYLALAACLWALARAHALDLVTVLSGLTGFLVIGAQYVLYALAPVYYAPEVRAAGAGAAVAVGRFGSIAGPLLAGELRQAGYSPGEVFLSLVPIVLVAGVAALTLTTIGKARPVER